MRINSRFHTNEKGELVKTSNGQSIPPEEPVFILRGRDDLAVKTLELYRKLAVADGCNDQFLSELDATTKEFKEFQAQYHYRMKQPGITRGK